MRFLPMGERALLVELDDGGAVRALATEVHRRRVGGWAPALVDVVPGARTLLLDGIDDVAAAIREMRAWDPTPDGAADTAGASEPVRIDCVYDGEDLADVARHWGVSVGEAIEIHAGTEHEVAFCGFAPGFAYMSGLGADHAVPRRDRPRPRVPAGSVALAGEYTGIYPSASPGGWRLIGRTDVAVWDLRRDPPALLAPGTRVRFCAVEDHA